MAARKGKADNGRLYSPSVLRRQSNTRKDKIAWSLNHRNDSALFPVPVNGAMTLLSDQTLGSDQASITISSINQLSIHLRLVVHGRITGAVTSDYCYIQFNGDTGTHYDEQHAAFSGSSSSINAAFSAAAGMGRLGALSGASASRSTQAGAFESVIYNYASTTFEKLCVTTAADVWGTTGSNLQNQLEGVFWQNAAAINAIKIIPGTGNLKAGTRITLYGF